jgi:hypothetical protein
VNAVFLGLADMSCQCAGIMQTLLSVGTQECPFLIGKLAVVLDMLSEVSTLLEGFRALWAFVDIAESMSLC